MKKQAKNTVAFLMAAAITLTSAVSAPAYGLFGTIAHASVISGEGQDEQFTGKWSYNSDTKTLTLSEKMYLKDVDNAPWKQYEAEIQRIVFSSELEIAGNQSNMIVYLCHTADYLSGTHPDGFSWEYEVSSQKLTLSGKGVWPTVNSYTNWAPWTLIEYYSWPKEIIVQDGITSLPHSALVCDTLRLGKDVELTHIVTNRYITTSYVVDEKNPYYSTYQNCLYSKDYTTLYSVPGTATPAFHASLKTLAPFCIVEKTGKTLTLPWGVQSIECSAIQDPIVVPDTVTKLADGNHYIGSANCAALVKYQQQMTSETVGSVTLTDISSYYNLMPNSFKTWGGNTYYFDANCKMVTGTQTINGKSYTFDENGVLQGEAPQEDESGSGSSTVTQPGFVTENGKTYYYKDGKKMTGLQYIDSKAYYFGTDGAMQKSKWIQADGNWYYLNDYGAGVVSCWRLKDNKYVYLGSDGKMKTNSWVKDYGIWYYVKADGIRYESCWAKIGGVWYWFGGSGKMAENQWLKLDGIWYYFYPSGAMASGQWVKTGGKWYYCLGSGAMAENRWVKSGAYWYYLGSGGAMLTNTTTPDGYHVDSEGRWI